MTVVAANPLLAEIDRLRVKLEPPLSREGVCVKANVNRAILRQLEKRGPAAGVNAKTLAKLAAALDVSVETLSIEIAPIMPDAAPPRSAEPKAVIPAVRQADPKTAAVDLRDVPVLGVAAGSAVGSFVLSGSAIDYVERPPALAHVRGAYAVFVENDSMQPLHNRGDLRFVHPHRPARSGDSVIVQVRSGADGVQAYIKILERRTEEWVVCRQLNPAAEVRFKRDQVIAVHRVLTLNELFNR